jgi:5-(carboxyamino)imidazole ribonucleotide synthase
MSEHAKRVLSPGDTIGILGGGQLGRMMALSAARLGLKCLIFAPEMDSPAFDVSAGHIVARYDDHPALDAFAGRIAAATFEFENVPADTVARLAARVPVRPCAFALSETQDRVTEKEMANRLGIATAPFAAVDSLASLEVALAQIGAPAVLKIRRFGYDGKGQAVIRDAALAAEAWNAVSAKPAILEGFVPFRSEASIVAARGIDGRMAFYEPTANEHRNGILHRSVVPAPITDASVTAMREAAEKIAQALDYQGVFAVEFFIGDANDPHAVRLNEIAPRVHNSGHWTLDGADTSQFEQHMRAVAGWPLGSVARRAASVEMLNLVGADADEWRRYLEDPGAQLHLYGKGEARAGRKMGHVTWLRSDD